MKLSKAKLQEIIKEELEGSGEAGTSGGYKVVLELAAQNRFSPAFTPIRFFIKNAAEVSSPKPDILIIDNIEIDLQDRLKVEKIEKV